MKPTFETSGLSLEDWNIVKDRVGGHQYNWHGGKKIIAPLEETQRILPFHVFINDYDFRLIGKWCDTELCGVWARIWITGGHWEFVFSLETDAVMFKLSFG
jgi:hypothetical protein